MRDRGRWGRGASGRVETALAAWPFVPLLCRALLAASKRTGPASSLHLAQPPSNSLSPAGSYA
eukprot:1146505-Pleurochrysis_carterae.AAC.1